jgi:glycine/D-amino acid oxidase-like deaminating enzyme
MAQDAYCDLVIIGGGGSGLAAAARARQLGVPKVTVVEKTPRPGGNAWLAVVMLGLGGAEPSEVLASPAAVTEWRERTLDEDLAAEAAWRRRVTATADSWLELARQIGVDAGALTATVERYNGHCDRGRDGDFVKEPAFLLPLRTPPYHAILGVRFCHGTAGG